MFISTLSPGAWAGIGIAIAVVALALIFAVWWIATRNKFVLFKNDVDESYSAMDVHMKKRYDLIPNLVETCKGYSKFESDTLIKVTEARRLAIAASPEDKPQAEAALGASLRTLLNAVNENYPDLKANGQFNNLSAQLEQLEHEIAQSRKFYNAKVKILNNKIEKFPSSSVARKMRLERVSYFEIEDATERNAPRVSFDDAPRTRL